MRKLQRARLQGANDTEGPPNDNVLCVLATDFCFEAVGDIGIRETLDALRHRAFQDNLEGVFVVARGEDFGLALASISESPCFLVKDALSPILAPAACGCRGEVPTNARLSSAGHYRTLAAYPADKNPRRGQLLTRHARYPSNVGEYA